MGAILRDAIILFIPTAKMKKEASEIKKKKNRNNK